MPDPAPPTDEVPDDEVARVLATALLAGPGGLEFAARVAAGVLTERMMREFVVMQRGPLRAHSTG